MVALRDPTAGDVPDNAEKANVIANILGAPTDPKSQAKMIEAVTDHNAETGHTKAPHIPVPLVHVTDVESKPDPIIVDADHESTEAPDSTKPVAEIGPAALAQQKSSGLSADFLAEINKSQQKFENENSNFLAIK